MNQSEEFSLSKENVWINNLISILFLIIEIVGICGNVLVICSIAMDIRMRRSLTNRLILQIASCDLIILLFNIPDLIQFISSRNGNWVLNQISCQLIRTILVLAQYSSVLTMCAVTIERFVGIVYPLRAKFVSETHFLHRLTFFIWTFSFLCSLPNLFYLRVVEVSSSQRLCLLQYSRKGGVEHEERYIFHKSMETILFYILPLLLQIFCYTTIARQLFHFDHQLENSFSFQENLREKSAKFVVGTNRNEIVDENHWKREEKELNCLTLKSSSMEDENVESREIVNLSELKDRSGSSLNRIQMKTLKSRRSVIKMLFVVVFIYFLSFSPQVLRFLLFETNLIRSIPLFLQSRFFFAFTMLLITISSASNPIVYAIFSSKFRQSFWKILRRISFC